MLYVICCCNFVYSFDGSSKKESLEYKSIQLENVISEIPTEIIESEEIILNKSENRFEIEAKRMRPALLRMAIRYLEDSDEA